MAYIGQNLEKKGVIIALLSLVLVNMSCEDKIDNLVVNPSERETVEVTLNIGFANELDGYTLSASPTTKSNQTGFTYVLQPAITTKGEATSIKPDKLYNLEIQQYDRSGNRIGGMTSAITEQAIGSALSLSLATNPDCQLIIVAWGYGNTAIRLGTGNLASAQTKSVASSTISSLQPDSQSDMNKMPYVLHLEHVCVEGNTIKSIEGQDVRLLLRRLAIRLTLNWSYTYSGYQMKQVLLQSIPLDYKIVPSPDKNNKTYPSLLDQFTTIQLTSSQINDEKYACWIPANVRGTNPAATSQAYRIKSNAPTGSSYVDFIASNTIETKKKLSYRVYLGGSESSDFNLYSNTDYNYEVKIDHTSLPINDRRVTIIDPVPASENNNNLVPTANCFMVVPGGSFCFNPYKYYINEVVTENSLLQGWCSSERIQSVKVLWQTKENGDVGDPVLGIVNSSEDHTNIVSVSNGEDFDKARIYCRVAPNTTGGSGVIAAYASLDETGNPLWSWHIWVTDYNPDPKSNITVLIPVNKRKLKFTYNNVADQPPIMDRNLGAMAGFTLSDPPRDQLDMSKANGLHYQWGRKDPFPSSYSADLISVVKGLTSKTIPPKGMLNRYAPDGITYVPLSSVASKTTVRNAFQHPATVYIASSSAIDWCSETSAIPTLWNSPDTETGTKTFHDPCPAGWRVVSYRHLRSFFTATPNLDGTVTDGAQNVANPTAFSADGGVFFYFSAKKSGEATYIRMTGYWRFTDEFHYIGQRANWWLREHVGTAGKANYGFFINGTTSTMSAGISQGWYPQDVHTTRCIQELE